VSADTGTNSRANKACHDGCENTKEVTSTEHQLPDRKPQRVNPLERRAERIVEMVASSNKLHKQARAI
jgi:hypothetical protein